MGPGGAVYSEVFEELSGSGFVRMHTSADGLLILVLGNEVQKARFVAGFARG
jgi:hypothetical protein